MRVEGVGCPGERLLCKILSHGFPIEGLQKVVDIHCHITSSFQLPLMRRPPGAVHMGDSTSSPVAACI